MQVFFSNSLILFPIKKQQNVWLRFSIKVFGDALKQEVFKNPFLDVRLQDFYLSIVFFSAARGYWQSVLQCSVDDRLNRRRLLVCLLLYLLVCSFVYLFVCLLVCLFICSFVYLLLFVCLFIFVTNWPTSETDAPNKGRKNDHLLSDKNATLVLLFWGPGTTKNNYASVFVCEKRRLKVSKHLEIFSLGPNFKKKKFFRCKAWGLYYKITDYSKG